MVIMAVCEIIPSLEEQVTIPLDPFSVTALPLSTVVHSLE